MSVDKDKILDNAIKQLFDQAFKDGVVDDKEFELIQQIEISIEDYVDGLNKALLDNVITPEESHQLESLKERILSDAEDLASADGEIDDEEASLLHKLSTIMEKYRTT